MNFEKIKIEPEFLINEFETCTSEKEELKLEKFIIKKRKKEDHLSGKDKNLLQLTKVEAYYQNDNQCSSGRGIVKKEFNNPETMCNSDEYSFLNCDSFEITYMNEHNDKIPRHPELDEEDGAEEITIIGCDPVIDTSQEKKETGRTVTEILWYKCNICPFKTSKKLIYDKHVNMHIGIGKLEMSKCHLCTFESIYPGNLKKHLLRHEKSKVFHCNSCSYTAYLKNALQDHIKNVHLKKYIEREQLYLCPDCDYTTKYVGNFKRHKNSCHENLLVCKFCKFKTTFRHKFVEHSIAHKMIQETSKKVTEKTVSQSKFCNYGSRHASLSTKHKKSQRFEVIRGDNLKVFKCGECGHATTDQSNFNRHLKCHEKNGRVKLFECYTCGLKTKYKVNLIKHTKKHRQQ